MRLIDADKLLPKLWVCYEENKPIVDGEPTVEAIPIEWIKTYARKYIDAEKLFPISCKGEGAFGYAIKLMVEEWEYELGEKENEDLQ